MLDTNLCPLQIICRYEKAHTHLRNNNPFLHLRMQFNMRFFQLFSNDLQRTKFLRYITKEPRVTMYIITSYITVRSAIFDDIMTFRISVFGYI